MWAQDQIFDSGNIFRLWSKYKFYCFKNPDKLPDSASTPITYLHQIWHHFTWPTFLQNSCKILVSEDSCEGSTTLAYPNSMKVLQTLTMTKSLSLAKFELKWNHHVAASSKCLFWTRFGSCKPTMIYLGPNLLKVTRMKILRYLNLADNSITPNHLPVDH